MYSLYIYILYIYIYIRIIYIYIYIVHTWRSSWKKASTLGACFELLSPALSSTPLLDPSAAPNAIHILSSTIGMMLQTWGNMIHNCWVSSEICDPEKCFFFFQGCRWIKYHLYDEYACRCIWIYMYMNTIMYIVYIYEWYDESENRIYMDLSQNNNFYSGESHSVIHHWGVQQITRPSWNQSLRVRRTFQGNAWVQELEIVKVSASKLSNSYWKYINIHETTTIL